MIYSVHGTLIYMEPSLAVVECGGVGYMVQTTITTQKQLKLNTEVMLYTYMNVREDAVDLFGFATKNELSAFKMLIGVSGVGPKAGLSILSELSFEQVAMAVASNDYKTITRANGVGPKLAQRIVLELKDKVKGMGSSTDFDATSGAGSTAFSDSSNISKAVSALAVLGYSSADVTPILSRLDSTLSVEQMISATLRQMV